MSVRAGWVVRHWRGELSLPQSYWINVVGISLAIAVAEFLAARQVSGLRGAWSFAAVVVSAWLAACLPIPWQTVGAWRAANRVARTRGRRFWPVVTRVVLVLGVILLGYRLESVAWPQLADSWRYLAGDPAYGPRGVRVLRDGTELEISGAFSRGSADAFAAALARAPEARVVHLDSPGGRLGMALAVRDMILAHGLDTLVEHRCFSACTIAFLGGRRRWLGERGELGFHAASAPGRIADAGNALFRSTYAAAGVPPWFIDHTLLTPPAELWRPTRQELSDARIVTDTAPDGQFARAGFGPAPSPSEILAAILVADPVMQALRDRDPQHWPELEAAWIRVIREGQTVSAVRSIESRMLSRASAELRPKAPDDIVTALARLMLDEMAALQARDPAVCARYMRVGEPGVGRYLPADLAKRDIEVTRRVLVETPRHPAARIGPQQATALMRKVVTQAGDRGGDFVKAFTRLAPTAPPEGVCPALTTIIEDALALPPGDSADLLRFLLGGR